MKNKIRPIYSELQGYLFHAPPIKTAYDSTSDKSLWEQLNASIDELNKVTGNSYDKYKISPHTKYIDGYTNGITDIKISEYKTKIGGLVSRLHGEYFYDETPPFGGIAPNTIINQTQNQNQQQSTYVSMLLEIQSKIDEKLFKAVDEKEKGFLQAIKSGLSAIKNTTELIHLILATAKTFGIPIDKLTNIFSS